MNFIQIHCWGIGTYSHLQYKVKTPHTDPTYHKSHFHCQPKPWTRTHMLPWARWQCGSREESSRSKSGLCRALKWNEPPASWTCKSRGMWESRLCAVQNNRPLSGLLQTSLAYQCGMTMVMWNGLVHCRVGHPLRAGMFVQQLERRNFFFSPTPTWFCFLCYSWFSPLIHVFYFSVQLLFRLVQQITACSLQGYDRKVGIIRWM